MNDFRAKLETGKAGESLIAKWLIKRGSHVLPVYEKIIDEGKGPQLFTAEGGIVAPDLLCFTNGKVYWVEAKTKTGFTWYRKKAQFETGIDMHHYEHYQRVAEKTSLPVWLLFLHRGEAIKDHPPELPQETPSGLFGGELPYLMKCESHRSDLHGRHGMVYWAHGSLYKFAELQDVIG